MNLVGNDYLKLINEDDWSLVVEIIEGAKRRLARKGGWCQNTSAKRADGMQVSPEAVEAISFCALGSIQISCHEVRFKRTFI